MSSGFDNCLPNGGLQMRRSTTRRASGNSVLSHFSGSIPPRRPRFCPVQNTACGSMSPPR